MKKIIISMGIFVIIVVTVCNFNKDKIKYLYTKVTLDYKYKYNTRYNDYYLKDNFLYFDNYTNPMINNKKDLINSIYYAINAGMPKITRYCNKDYLDCSKDFEELTKNKELLSVMNNFAHPYNTFSNIYFELNDNYIINISFDYLYSQEEINEINTIINKVINEHIKDNMTDKEKIKVIHDYIINKAKYDNNWQKENSKYKSNTALGVLVNGYGICSGYTDAMAIFLDKLGIINYRIDNDKHSWNLIYIDNKWLHLDLTWDDPVTDTGEDVLLDTYFLITNDKLKELNDDVHYYNKEIYLEVK